jgi:hypothetical protein
MKTRESIKIEKLCSLVNISAIRLAQYLHWLVTRCRDCSVLNIRYTADLRARSGRRKKFCVLRAAPRTGLKGKEQTAEKLGSGQTQGPNGLRKKGEPLEKQPPGLKPRILLPSV